MSDLSEVLQGLLVPNNEIRRRAEEYFQTIIAANPGQIMLNLAQISAATNVDFVIRTLSAVLLRRSIEKTLPSLSAEEQVPIKQIVFNAWSQESSIPMSNKFAHVIAQIATVTPWENFFHTIVNSSAPQRSVLHLLEISTEYFPDALASNAEIIWSYLSTSLNSSTHDILVSAAKSTSACVAVITNDEVLKVYQTSLLPMLQILSNILARGDEQDATIMIDRLIEVAQFKPTFFKNTMDAVANAMLTIGNHDDFEFSTRSAAMELLVTLCEAAPAMVRRTKGFVENLVELVLKLLLCVDDDEISFQKQNYNEEIDEDAIDAGYALERIATGLGGKSVAEIILSRIQQLSASSDWRYRRAAIDALTRLAEGCSDYFAKYVSQAIIFLITSVQDVSVRVKYESLQVSCFSCLFFFFLLF
jgi:importin-5